MNVGIVGLPTSGKSCLFNALTRGEAQTGRFGAGRAEINRGRILVPDERLDWLSAEHSPKKTTPAAVDFLDIPGITPGSVEKAAAGLIADLRMVETLLHVVRVFDDPAIPHPDGSIDPRRDANEIETELVLADLGVVEKRLTRIESDLGKGLDRRKLGEEKELLERLRASLEDGTAIHALGLDPDELQRIKGYAFLTVKPQIVIANVSEADIAGGEADAGLREWAAERGLQYLTVSAQIESEIARMDDAEAAAFLEDLGIEETSRDRVIHAAYDALSLISFFTFGDDECRAWTLPRNSSALEAAGKIHTDLARGFIRAEVVPFDELRNAGSWAGARDAGHHRLEGKEYVVQDGDCLIVRFSI